MLLKINKVDDGYSVVREDEKTGENYLVKTFRELMGMVVELINKWGTEPEENLENK